MKRIHFLERDEVGKWWETAWLACRDPERFQEPADRPVKFEWTYEWAKVTCKRCLAKREGGTP